MPGVYVYWTAGSRLRRAYREAQARGTTLWLDEEPSLQTGEAPGAR